MTTPILWMLLAVALVVIAALVLVGRAQAKTRDTLSEPARNVNPACAIDGHVYQPLDTGYRCATCGNHVSSSEGELYGRAEDGRRDRRREPR